MGPHHRWLPLLFVVLATSATAQETFLVNNWAQPNSNYGWAGGFTFNQNFVAGDSATITEVAVQAGNNQNPLNLNLVITASGTPIYSHLYTGLVQRTTDWALSMPVSPATRVIRKGEVVTLSITPNTLMGMAAVLVDNASWPRSNLQGYGNVALKFYVKGVKPPPPPSADGHTYINVGEVLNTGEHVIAGNRAFFAVMQGDGNFCVYPGVPGAATGPAAWCSMVTAPGGVFYATMQKDGNFCVYPGTPADGRGATWCTNKVAAGGQFFALMNGDGNFIVNSGTAPTSTGIVWQDGIVFAQVEAAAPSGGGSISWPNGKACPPVCSEILRVGTVAAMTVNPPPDMLFKNWTGKTTAQGGCSDQTTNPCNLTVAPYAAGPALSAEYKPGPVTLTISPRPAGGIVWIPDGEPYYLKINCGDFTSDGSIRTDCALTVPKGTVIKLQASIFHTDQYEYNSFTGACAGQNYVCTLTMDSSKTASATFATRHLTATTSTTGYITASPAVSYSPYNAYLSSGGLNCGTSDGGTVSLCSAIAKPGSGVTVRANPRLGYVFSSWSGACAGKPNPCSLTMNSDASVAAAYQNVGTYMVTVTTPPTTTVTGAGMNCRGTCSVAYTQGTPLGLTAVADTGYYFTGWAGDCAGQGNPCNLTINANKSLTVSAAAIQTVVLTVSPKPVNGIVYLSDGAAYASINCGDFAPNNPRTQCSLRVNKGTRVVLQADKFYNTGYHWTSFSGACAGQAYSCTLTMDTDKTMSAAFSQ